MEVSEIVFDQLRNYALTLYVYNFLVLLSKSTFIASPVRHVFGSCDSKLCIPAHCQVNQNHGNLFVFSFELCGHLFYHGVVPLIFPYCCHCLQPWQQPKTFQGLQQVNIPVDDHFKPDLECVIWIWLWVKTHHGLTQHEPNHHHAWMLAQSFSLQPCHRLHKSSHNMFLFCFVFATEIDGSQRTSAEDCICDSIYVYDPVVTVNQSQKLSFKYLITELLKSICSPLFVDLI